MYGMPPIVAPTSGISEDSPAQKPSSGANGTPMIVRNIQTATPPVRATRNIPTT